MEQRKLITGESFLCNVSAFRAVSFSSKYKKLTFLFAVFVHYGAVINKILGFQPLLAFFIFVLFYYYFSFVWENYNLRLAVQIQANENVSIRNNSSAPPRCV